MTDLQQFEFDGTMVRTVLVDGDPWFVAKDVATVLGYTHTPHLTRSLDEDEKGVHGTDTLGGTQSLNIISEGGLFRAIIQRQTGRMNDDSVRAQVKNFQRWVTHTVLPTIRRTGTYAAPAVPTDRTELLALAVLEANKALEEKDQRIAALEPAATFAQTVLSAEGDMTVGDAAKALANAGVKTGQNRLFSQLHAMGWIYRSHRGTGWSPVQTRIEAGHLSVLPQSHYHPKTGELVLDPPQVRVTASGLRLLAERMAGAAVATQFSPAGVNL